MAVDLIVTYKAEVDDLTNKLKVVIDRLDTLEKESKSAAKGLDETTKSADKLDKELSTTGKSTKTATDNIKNFSKTAKNELNAVSSSVKSVGLSIAASLGAAFTVDAIIQFGKASVNAFLEAEENANRLKFAVTQIAGESEAAFSRLIAQSAELQNISIFSDDAIQQAQTALATFGLTSDKIEEIIPKIAEFASATKTDVTQATSVFIKALEGQSRGLVEAGLKFKDTGTILGNYNELLQSTAKFTGATEEATKTLSGQLKQLDNQADELQESLGSRLAGELTQLRFATFKLFETIIKGFDTVEQKRAQAQANQRDLIQSTIEANIAGDAAIRGLTIEEEAQRRLIETGRRIIEIKKEIAAQPSLFPGLDTERQKLIQTAGVLKEIIDLEKQKSINTSKLLSIEFIRNQQTDELNRLLEENAKFADVVSKDNVTNINKELEARKKLADQAAKNADVRTPGLEAEIKLVESLSAEYRDLLALLSEPQKQQLIELSIKGSFDIEAFKAEIAKQVAASQDDLTVPLVLEPRVDDVAFNDGLDKIEDDVEITNEQILSSSLQLFNELTNLYNQFSNQRISDTQKVADAEVENIDKALQANDEALKNRRISERDAANEKIRLETEKVKAEQEADKKIRAIKRQQAIINKIAALAEIAISTAKNIAEIPALAAFYLVIGTAQAAVVAAQPIPYKKGSKKTKEGLARVGEEGEEIMWMPGGAKVLPHKQTRTYGAALDAMFDNRFDKWVIQEYAPKLIAQQKTHKESEVRSFSKNLADSLTVNVAAPMASRKSDKFAMTNVEELAEAIVRSSYISPYRR